MPGNGRTARQTEFSRMNHYGNRIGMLGAT